jgi:hypothetical protein
MASEEQKLHGRIAELRSQRDRAIKAATDLAVALETVLDEYRQAQTDMEYERGDCHNWTTGEAIAELPLGVARIIKLYVSGDGIERLTEEGRSTTTTASRTPASGSPR